MKSLFKLFKYVLYVSGALFAVVLIAMLFVPDDYEEEVVEETEVSEEESSTDTSEGQSVSKEEPVSNITFANKDRHRYRGGNNRGNTVYVVTALGVNDPNNLNMKERADLKVYGRKQQYTENDFFVYVYFYDSSDIPNLDEFSGKDTGEVLDYIDLEHSEKPFAVWQRFTGTGNTELTIY
jgi:hypothetical protein